MQTAAKLATWIACRLYAAGSTGCAAASEFGMRKVGVVAVLCGLLAGFAALPAAASEHARELSNIDKGHARDVDFHKDLWYAQAFTTGGSPLHFFQLTDIKVRFGYKSGEPGR